MSLLTEASEYKIETWVVGAVGSNAWTVELWVLCGLSRTRLYPVGEQPFMTHYCSFHLGHDMLFAKLIVLIISSTVGWWSTKEILWRKDWIVLRLRLVDANCLGSLRIDTCCFCWEIHGTTSGDGISPPMKAVYWLTKEIPGVLGTYSTKWDFM